MSEAHAWPTFSERLASREVMETFGDDPDSVLLCLELFLACKPEYAQQIRSGMTAREPETLQRIGHVLAGSFIGIVRPHLLAQARELEDEAAAQVRTGGSLDSAIKLAARLLSVLNTIEEEVRATLRARGSANEARQVTSG